MGYLITTIEGFKLTPARAFVNLIVGKVGVTMSVLLEFSMTPLDKGESVSPYIARSLDIIDKSGVDYRLGAMGTCVEGEWDDVMGVVKQCFDRMKQDCHRVTLSIKIDYRKGSPGRLSSKVQSVEKQLGRKLKQ